MSPAGWMSLYEPDEEFTLRVFKWFRQESWSSYESRAIRVLYFCCGVTQNLKRSPGQKYNKQKPWSRCLPSSGYWKGSITNRKRSYVGRTTSHANEKAQKRKDCIADQRLQEMNWVLFNHDKVKVPNRKSKTLESNSCILLDDNQTNTLLNQRISSMPRCWSERRNKRQPRKESWAALSE